MLLDAETLFLHRCYVTLCFTLSTSLHLNLIFRCKPNIAHKWVRLHYPGERRALNCRALHGKKMCPFSPGKTKQRTVQPQYGASCMAAGRSSPNNHRAECRKLDSSLAYALACCWCPRLSIERHQEQPDSHAPRLKSEGRPSAEAEYEVSGNGQ